MLRRLALIGLALTVLSGCAGYRPQSAEFNNLLLEPYRLDSGDNLRVTVFDQPNLTNTYAVDTSGYISMPLIGMIEARGHTTDELEDLIEAALRQGFLRSPDVSAEVQTYRPFFVMGEVRNAGQFPYVPGTTVQTAIAIAGGFTARAVRSTVDVTRSINGEVISGRVEMTEPIRPGDTIYIRERWF